MLWNSQWFGGHAVLNYSVIAPAISAPIGPLALGALSGIASAFMFERILRFSFGPIAWLGSLWFALGTVINLIVGRTTYAFGVVLALGRDLRAPAPPGRDRGRVRGAVLAREPARRMLPRDRRVRVGRLPARAAHAGARAPRRRARADRHDRGALPDRPGTSRTNRGR